MVALAHSDARDGMTDFIRVTGRGNLTAMTDLITVNGGNVTLRIMVKDAGEGRGGGGAKYDRRYHDEGVL